MTSTALDAALADIDTVFNGFASPNEVGCGRCHLPEEIAFLRTPYTRVPPDVLRMFVFEVPGHFDDHAALMRRLLPQGARPRCGQRPKGARGTARSATDSPRPTTHPQLPYPAAHPSGALTPRPTGVRAWPPPAPPA
ncbi:hypothetical protein OG762_08960 [Streptomyces sp. NBC_01136]|uniref:hypothetical protein n=1 Tax=Streptomyces sp. NBC_01136 TaxID=2903754 RepID=UPI00386F3AE2|nr:hypothetical protein OG762_08960 [Streptomyces sp. NBC_01136]